jgi:predicted aldo/keto reductase-like oxidoreductase
MADTTESSFVRGRLGRTGREVCRLGLAAGYGVPEQAVESAFEQGVNYLYWGSRRTGAFAQALRNLRARREQMVLVIQSYSRFPSLLGRSLEGALRTIGYDYADALLLGMWNKPVKPALLDAARELQRRGLVRHLAVSTHARKLVPEIAAGDEFDLVHFRYNAAHPGAESDIFPHLPAGQRPGLTSFTATSWGQLLGRAMLQGIVGSHAVPKGEPTPTATDCYRFVLSRPEVDVCMAGPSNAGQMDQALKALQLGPMTDDEVAWMRRVGRAVAGK